MEEAPEKGKESLHSAQASGMNEEISNNEIYNCLSPINVCTSVFLKEGSTVVRQVSKLRAGQSGVRISAGARDFSLLKT